MRTRTQQQFASLAQSAYDPDAYDDNGLMQDNELGWNAQEPHFRVGLVTVAASVVWILLVLAATLLLGGEQIGTGGFWVGGGLAAFLVVALMPVGAVLLYRWLDFRLRDLGAQSDDVREEIARFTEPAPANSSNVISIRHVVHKELAMLNEQLERSMTRTVAIEEKVRAAIDAMEKAFNDNERRLFSIVQELARQRESVSSATEQVRESMRDTREALQTELEGLTRQIVEAGNYARGTVEEVNRGVIDAVADAAEGLAQNISAVVQADIEPMKQALDQRLLALRHVIANSGEGMVQALDEQRAQIGADMEAALGRIAEELERQATLADEIISQASTAVEGNLDTALGSFEDRIRERSEKFRSVLDQGGLVATAKLDEAWDKINSAFGEKLGVLESELETRLAAFTDAAAEAGRTLVPALEQGAVRMERAIAINAELAQSTEKLESVLEERGERLIKTVSMQFEGFHNAVGSRSEAISKALAEKLAQTFARIDAHAEELAGTLSAMEASVQASAGSLSVVFGSGAEQLRETIELGSQRIEHSLEEAWAVSERSLVQNAASLRETIVTSTTEIETTLQASWTASERSMVRHVDALREAFDSGSAELETTLAAARSASERSIQHNAQVLREAAAQGGLELTRAFTAALEQLDVAVRRDAEAVAGTGRQSAAALHSASEEMVRDLIGAADSIVDGLRARLDVVRTDLRDVGETALEPINRTLNDLISGLEQKTGALSETLDGRARALDANLGGHLRRLSDDSETFLAARAAAAEREAQALSEVLDARANMLQALIEARSRDFAERMGQSSAAFEGMIGEAMGRIAQGFSTGIETVGTSTAAETGRVSERLRELGTELMALMDVQQKALADEFSSQRLMLATAFRAEETKVQQIFAEQVSGLEGVLAAGIGDLVRRIDATGTELGASLNAAADRVRDTMTAEAGRIGSETGSGLGEVSAAISGVAARIETSLKETIAGLEARLQETTRIATDKLGSEEKAAVRRMEQATAAVTESTRRAAEVAAERVVALNSAVVQALGTLDSPIRKQADRAVELRAVPQKAAAAPKPAPAEAKADVPPAAAEANAGKTGPAEPAADGPAAQSSAAAAAARTQKADKTAGKHGKG